MTRRGSRPSPATAATRNTFPASISPTALTVEPVLSRAVGAADACLVAVPSHAFAELVAALAAMPASRAGLLWATKGLDPSSGRLLHEVAAELLPPGAPLGVLSGPTFAAEVARRLPTAVTLAATDAGFAREWADRLANPRFRVYTSDDVAGVQIAGAVKNVLAIAAGIADGLGFGANTRAALIARGLSEMVRLGEAAGGRAVTFMGLAGLGDLVLTCTDDQSRNRRFGLALARGVPPDDAAAALGQVVEGVETSAQVMELARQYRVQMPICEPGSGRRDRRFERRRGSGGIARARHRPPRALITKSATSIVFSS